MKINHQKFRKVLQIIFTPILLLPVIVNMLSPFLVFLLPYIDNSAVVFCKSVLILWIIITLLSIFVGRAYCSHVCPVTGLFNFISFIKHDKKILSMEYPKVMGKIMLLFWITAPLYVIIRNIGNYTELFHYEEIYSDLTINIYYILFAVSGILAHTYGKISVRHYTCPFASFMISANRVGRKFRLRTISFNYNKELCKHCGKCKTNCMTNRDIPKLMDMGLLNFDECVQCGFCAENCRYSAITCSWSSYNDRSRLVGKDVGSKKIHTD